MSEPQRKSELYNKNKGIIVSNFDVMSKIENDYMTKKKNDEIRKSTVSVKDSKARPKVRSKDDCQIF